jgi:ParB family chromosome partitioning protein
MNAAAKYKWDVDVPFDEAKALRIIREIWGNARPQGTGDGEWYTPMLVLNPARAVLGDFDLDPASCAYAQKTVRAKRWFSKEDDGLRHDWRGSVWLNPPFSDMGEFTQKLITELHAGRVTAAILFGPSNTDTAWCQKAFAEADAVCFTRVQIPFYKSNGAIAKPSRGYVIFYFGPDVDKFREHFKSVGEVLPHRVTRGGR